MRNTFNGFLSLRSWIRYNVASVYTLEVYVSIHAPVLGSLDSTNGRIIIRPENGKYSITRTCTSYRLIFENSVPATRLNCFCISSVVWMNQAFTLAYNSSSWSVISKCLILIHTGDLYMHCMKAHPAWIIKSSFRLTKNFGNLDTTQLKYFMCKYRTTHILCIPKMSANKI